MIPRGVRRIPKKARASNKGTRSLLSQARTGLYGPDDKLALKAMALSRALDEVLGRIGKATGQLELRRAA